MIEIYQKTLKSTRTRKLKDISRSGVWINVVNPNEKEIKELVEKTNINKQFIRDALDIYEAPRIEEEKGIFYILTRTPYKDADNLTTTVPLLIILTPENIITISAQRIEFIQNFISAKIQFCTTQKAKFLIQIFLKISQSYEQYTKFIARDIQRKKIILRELENKDIINLVEWEEVLNNFITSLVPSISVFEGILRKKFISLYEEDKELVDDLIIASRQSLELCKTSIKSITNTREAYSTILTNNLNKIIKFLTSITIILTIPTIIASIYGMNIDLPIAKNPLAFGYIGLLILALMLLFFWFFYKKRWL